MLISAIEAQLNIINYELKFTLDNGHFITAVERLQRKYRKLIHRGVNHNKAVVAAARELACFIWGMETGRIN